MWKLKSLTWVFICLFELRDKSKLEQPLFTILVRHNES